MLYSTKATNSFLFALLLVSLLSLLETGNCQEYCTQGFPDLNEEEENTETLTKQFVVPDYVFQCSAIVTVWEAIVHIDKQSSTTQFQVWRGNRNQTAGYHLVGTHSFKRKHSSSEMQKRSRYIFLVTDSQPQLLVEPGDIVGVFASNINIHYATDDDIDVQVYSADLDAPLGGIFSPLNLDPAFNTKLRGAPLITVQLDTNIEGYATAPVPQNMSLPGIPIDSTKESSKTLPLNTTTTLPMNRLTTSHHGGTSAWIQHKEVIIGVTICGVVMISLCFGIIVVTVMLFIRAQKRKRVGSVSAGGMEDSDGKICPRFTFKGCQAGPTRKNGVTNGVHGIHMTVLLTDSNSANTSEDHSYAYINSDRVNLSDNTVKSKPRPIVRSRPPTLPPARIAVRQNPCYSTTPATSTEDLDIKSEAADGRVENIYDLPVFVPQPRQAREYEVPIKSPQKSTPQPVVKEQPHVYELTDNNQYV